MSNIRCRQATGDGACYRCDYAEGEYTMQFLVSGENIDSGYLIPPAQIMDILEMAVLPSFQMMAQAEQEGKVKGGTFPGERGGALIVEAGSLEELDTFLNSLPFFGPVKWNVKP